MPDSLTSQDLKNLRAIFPNPPYQIKPYNYSYFMGDDPRKAQSMSEAELRHRKLVQGSTAPRMRLRQYENVSAKEPYAMYTDVELKSGPPADDGWPYQSYYYLMDYDQKGPIAVRPGDVVYVPSARLRGRGFVNTGPRYHAVQAPRNLPNPVLQKKNPTDTYIALEGW